MEQYYLNTVLGAGGPDLLGNVYTPRGNIQVHSPYLEVAAFNPRSKYSSTGKKNDKRRYDLYLYIIMQRLLIEGLIHMFTFYVFPILYTLKFSESTSALGASLKNNAKPAIWMPWKKHSRPYSPDKLVIPLPVPHPAHIAITIYNRDSDDPIPLESEICQSILRGIEESHGSPDETGSKGNHFLFQTLLGSKFR